ncbi:MAG: hypothetical protein IT578_09785 [Verrucomicrobiae bacterium]|nr:hypothetical protein [Verrucomicrobiae bacterium]
MSRVFAAACALLPCVLRADVLALYQFNGRTASGTSLPLTDNYDPLPASGERGPPLERLHSPVALADLENNLAPHSLGRESLHLGTSPAKTGATVIPRSYGSRTGLLPSSGSFTWEMVVAVHAYNGVGKQSVILDNTLGTWQGYEASPDGATVSRLALEPLTHGVFNIRWVLPKDNNGGCVWLRSSSLKLLPDQYYHIVAVYDEANTWARLYVDGALIAQNKRVTLAGGRNANYALGAAASGSRDGGHTLPSANLSFDALAFSDDAREPGAFMIPETSASASQQIGKRLVLSWMRGAEPAGQPIRRFLLKSHSGKDF